VFAAHAQPAYRRIAVAKDIELIQLSESAFVHVSWSELPDYGWFPSNGLVFASKGEAFLFDTPMTESLTKDLVSWITDSLKVKIVGFVPNHWHRDCTGGLAYLHGKKVKSYANQQTIDLARSKGLPLPEVGFKDSLQLKLGDRTIQCFYPGAAHSTDNIVVWIPSEKILFAGCMVKSMDAKNLGNTADGDLKAYPNTLRLVLRKFSGAKIVIPGHGDFGGIELINHSLSLLK
jgi:metallo-beta-lactamase class B